MEEQYDIPHKTFVGLNPEINDNCTNLYNGDSYVMISVWAMILALLMSNFFQILCFWPLCGFKFHSDHSGTGDHGDQGTTLFRIVVGLHIYFDRHGWWKHDDP